MFEHRIRGPACREITVSSYLSECGHNGLEISVRDRPTTTFHEAKSTNSFGLPEFVPNGSNDQVKNELDLTIHRRTGNKAGFGRETPNVERQAICKDELK